MILQERGHDVTEKLFPSGDRIVFGSDWPHAEGTAHPLDYLEAIVDLEPDLQRRVMYDNVVAALGG